MSIYTDANNEFVISITQWCKDNSVDLSEYLKDSKVGFPGFSEMKHSEESKKLMSESKKGEKNKRYGKKHTKESRKKMSVKLTGRKLSLEHKNKISKLHKGKIILNETRRKLSKSHQGMKKPWVSEHNKSDFMRKVASCKKSGTSEKMMGNKNHQNNDIVCCPHCSKTGGRTIMMRWHFDKCKMS